MSGDPAAAAGQGASAAGAPIPVGLASVEGLLTTLWKHEPAGGEKTEGVRTRACMSNLMIVCRGRADADAVASEVAAVVRRHPSRVLLLVAEGGARPIEAEVSAHCHVSGGNRQVCSEMVAIRAGGGEARKLPSAARSLLIGDLPTSLWWNVPEPPPTAGPVFDELLPMADQVIYSSHQWADPVRGTRATADWVLDARPGDALAVDLAWRELAPWRRLIGQSLDPAALPGAVRNLTEVEIDHGPHGLPQAWLLAGWLASCLGWAATDRSLRRGREMSWRFETAGGGALLRVRRDEAEGPRVARVRVSWRLGGTAAALTFLASGPGRLTASAEGVDRECRVLAGSPVTRADAVAGELDRMETDAAFRDALRVSRALAENLDLA